jgi:hypothetical protein
MDALLRPLLEKVLSPAEVEIPSLEDFEAAATFLKAAGRDYRKANNIKLGGANIVSEGGASPLTG